MTPQERWREKNRENVKAYQRDYMRARRAAGSSKATKLQEGEAATFEPVRVKHSKFNRPAGWTDEQWAEFQGRGAERDGQTDPAGKSEPVPLTTSAPGAETGAEKMARIMAEGRAKMHPEPVLDPAPDADALTLGYPEPPTGFDGFKPDVQKRWIAENWAGLLGDDTADEQIAERLAEVRAKTGRRRL